MRLDKGCVTKTFIFCINTIFTLAVNQGECNFINENGNEGHADQSCLSGKIHHTLYGSSMLDQT